MDMEILQNGMQGEPTHLSRPGQAVITTATRDRFDSAAHAVWPLLVARLRRAGASPEDAEDVAQEALLRAWDRHISFADDGDLLRWCTVVARRSHIDRIRQQARRLDLGDPASDSACRELEAVELRHILGTVSTAMARLTEQERASLQPVPTGPRGDRASQVRTAVARHRARGRLRLLVGPFAAVLAQVARVLRRGAPAVAVGALAAAVLSVIPGVPLHTAPPTKHAIASGKPVTASPAAGRDRRGPASVGPARARRSTGSAHRAVRPPAAMKPIAHVNGPSQTGFDVHQDQSQPGDHWVCVNEKIVGLGDYCVH